MPLTAGTRVGAYEILELIGAGGMGEVYRARDTKLRREVALKVLPDTLAHDPDRLARFQREAEVVASFNHPNIAAVYGLAESDDRAAIVLELVEGDTLADVIARGPLALDDALPIARQVADALETAHDKGIVHRDLKPSNIKVCADGTVKVLDFGLAKMVETSGPSSVGPAHPSVSPTLTVHATMAGVVLGTAAYMSPEQARGKPVDRRADVWAFACVLFEMLTGRPPFEAGDTVTDTIAAIIKNEPDWRLLPPATPARIVALLRRCLQKDPRRRLPHIGVARLEIEDALAEPSSLAPIDPQAGRRVTPIVPWAVAALAVAAAGVVGTLLLRHQEQAGLGAVRFSITGGDLTLGNNVLGRGSSAPAPHFAPSPDGRSIVFVAFNADQKSQLWVRRLDTLTTRALAGSDDASFPFWSPDGRFIGFFAQGKLKRVDVSGGPPLMICDAPAGEGGTWNSDGVIVFARDGESGLFRVPASGGVAAPLTRLDAAHSEVSHRWPQFLPDGRHFLYLAMIGSLQGRPIIGTASLDNLRVIYVGALDSPDRTIVLRGALRAMYGSGHLLFLRGATLMAQPFDLRAQRLTGEAVPIADRIANNTGNGRTAFSLSENGVLTYRNGITAGGRSTLSWLDRTGKRLGPVGAPGDYVQMHLSPDGKTVAALIATRLEDTFPPGPGPQGADIWTLDLARNGISDRLTYRPDQLKAGVAWSPDGSRLVFGAVDNPLAGGSLYEKAVPSVADERLLFASDNGKRPTSWSPDGRFVSFTQIDDRTIHRDLWLFPMFGDRKPRPFLVSTFSHEQGAFSPDGRWIAYASDQAGTFDVYVRAFPGGEREWRISQGGGNVPQWRSDGRELFYWAQGARAMMAVPITSAASIEPGTPVKLFEVPLLRGGGIGQYSVTPDGRRFLIIEPESGDRPTSQEQAAIHVVLNWTAALNK